MEKIHRSSTRNWISDEVVLKEFREKYSGGLLDFYMDKSKNMSIDDKFKEVFPNHTQEEVEKVKKKVSIDNLMCAHEELVEVSKNIKIPEDAKLLSLKLQRENVKKRDTIPRFRNHMFNSGHYNNYPRQQVLGIRNTEESELESISDEVELPEIILTVEVYCPQSSFSKRLMTDTCRAYPNLKVDQEFYVLGCQYLSELRDLINCISDSAVPGDLSESPDQPVKCDCKDLYKSGFFYINGTFYNDYRDEACRDYSQVIISWAQEGDRGIGPFATAQMEETQFIDLTIKLGYPYVYLHQGYCEHLLVFKDLRMLCKNDSLSRRNYPMATRYIMKKRRVCMACLYNTARWVVKGKDNLPSDPYFFCDICFKAFNYDEFGNKIGNFEAHMCFDRTTII